MRKCLTKFSWILECGAAQKFVNLVDLVKSFQFISMSLFLNLLFETDSYSNEYLLEKFGFDTAENEPLTAWVVISFIYSFAFWGAIPGDTGVAPPQLVAQVKQKQREDPGFREAWYQFVEREIQGPMLTWI